MDKAAIKTFAISARNKLISDISFKAGLLGVTEKEIQSPLPQSTKSIQFFDIGTRDPHQVTGIEIEQRDRLVDEIRRKEKQSDYLAAYKNVIEEVAYTWFNRLIAIRFMEVNDYLPTRIRVLSSHIKNKLEPDLVTHALEANLNYSPAERELILQLKRNNRLDELFRMLFIKQCNGLNESLPELFEKTDDFSELLLNISFTDREGVVYSLVNGISEDDFNIEKEGQVEIIGWLYQYYNTEPKKAVDLYVSKGIRVNKDDLPAKTQVFTPQWVVRYMVENSLGRLWLDGHPENEIKKRWEYYLDEPQQNEEASTVLAQLSEYYRSKSPKNIKLIDPAMGSGHILVYAFEILMQIYKSIGYLESDAARHILKHNLYGLDIDRRAYQLAYFSLIMKACQYDKTILDAQVKLHLYYFVESNQLDRADFQYIEAGSLDTVNEIALAQIRELTEFFLDAREFGSIIRFPNLDFNLMRNFIRSINNSEKHPLYVAKLEPIKNFLNQMISIAEVLSQQYDAVITNPPYLSINRGSARLKKYLNQNYPYSKNDLSTVFMQRMIQMCTPFGYISAINIPVWMSKSTFTNFRYEFLNNHTFINMLHCGRGIFGSDFGTTAFVVQNSSISSYLTLFHQLFDEMGAVDAIELKEQWFFERKGRYIADQRNFLKIASYPMAYATSQAVLEILDREEPLCDFAFPRKGLTTGDNETFVRFWFEISASKFSIFSESAKWFPMTKGGDYRRWYGNNNFVVNWENEGKEIRNFRDSQGKLRSRPQNLQFYFRECISWNDTSAKGKIAMRYQPPGYIPNASGPCVYADNNLTYLLGLLNSIVSQTLLEVLAPNMKFEVGQMALVPIIIDTNGFESNIVNSLVDIAKSDWDFYETSWEFKCHPLVRLVTSHAQRPNNKSTPSDEIRSKPSKGLSLADVYEDWLAFNDDMFKKVQEYEAKNNEFYLRIYGLSHEIKPDVDTDSITIRRADYIQDMRSLISYAVGCMLGRYSLDVDGLVYAGEAWDSRNYTSFLPVVNNIIPITDIDYFESDIVNYFVRFIEVVYGEDTLEDNLAYVAGALGNKGNSPREIIRNYFTDDFFQYHCSVYSATGSGKAPIYWLFDSGEQNGFKALIYLHRYDEDLIGTLRVEYLHPLQRIYEAEIANLQSSIDNANTSGSEKTASRKRQEKLIKQLQETREYDEKIAHLSLAHTPLNLDDGVKVNYEKLQTDRDGKKWEVLAKI